MPAATSRRESWTAISYRGCWGSFHCANAWRCGSPRWSIARRVLFRTEAESLLAARRVIALAALPVIAGLALQSSTAGGTSHGLAPAVTTPAAASLLAPPGGASDRLGIAVAGITGVAGTAGSAGLNAPVARSSEGTPTLKSLADGVQQSIGQLVPNTPLAGSAATVPSAPSLAVPAVPTVPPVPSLPPIGH